MKLITLNSVRTFSTIAITTIGLLSSSGISAASACKGLDSAACGLASSCGWVDGYQRKDGRKVTSFCRTKSAKKSKSTVSKNLSK